MSIACMRWVIENSPAKGADRAVLLMIAYHANDDGANAWPSIDLLVEETKLSRRAVCYSISSLVSERYLEMDQGGGRGNSNGYRVPMRNSANDDINSATIAPFSETVQTETVQSTTERVQSTTERVQPLHPNRNRTVIEPPEEKKKPQHAREVPENLVGFDAILRETGNGHYDPTDAFYVKVSTKYGALDLEEEALKAVSWLKGERARKLKRTCSTAFILNWLKNAMEDRSGTVREASQGKPDTSRRGHSDSPGNPSPFARYGSTG